MVVSHYTGLWFGDTLPSKPQHIDMLMMDLDKNGFSAVQKTDFLRELGEKRVAEMVRPLTLRNCQRCNRQSRIIHGMSENAFSVLRLGNEAGKFIATPWSSSNPPSVPFGLVSSEQTFRGTEEETRGFLADQGQSSLQIEMLIKRAKDSPAINAPEYL